MHKHHLFPLALLVMVLSAAVLAAGCGPGGSARAVGAEEAPPLDDAGAEAQRLRSEWLDLLKPLAVSPDGEFAAVGLDGFTLFDRTGAATLEAAEGKRIRGLHWSPRGRWLLVNAAGPSLLLIAPHTGSVMDLTAQLPDLQDAPLAVSWSPDEREALVAEGYHTVDQSTVWLLRPHDGTATQLTTVARLEAVQWLQGGKGVLQVSAGCCEPMNLFIRLADGTSLPGEDFARGGAFAPDARRFAAAPYMGATLTIHDLVSGKRRTLWRGVPPGDPPLPEGAQYRMSPGLWSPDGRHLALVIDTWAEGGEPRRTLRIVDAADGAQRLLVRDWVPAMAWLPDGGGLLYATRKDQTLTVHLSDRALAAHQGGAALGLGSTAPLGVVSPDGTRLAYAITFESSASQLFVADLATGAVVPVPESADLAPLLWTADGTGLLVAHAPVVRTLLPDGSEGVGRELTGVRVIQP